MAQIPDAVIEVKEGITKWEYKGIFLYNSMDNTDKLNSLGQEGWELVNIIIPDAESSPVAYFKRPILELQNG